MERQGERVIQVLTILGNFKGYVPWAVISSESAEGPIGNLWAWNITVVCISLFATRFSFSVVTGHISLDGGDTVSELELRVDFTPPKCTKRSFKT